jgi:hypothetical protein
MSSVTSCVGGGLFICFTCLHVPYSTVTINNTRLLCYDSTGTGCCGSSTACRLVYSTERGMFGACQAVSSTIASCRLKQKHQQPQQQQHRDIVNYVEHWLGRRHEQHMHMLQCVMCCLCNALLAKPELLE